MKITLFWSYYQRYLQSIYDVHPGLIQQPYQQQLDVILLDYFGWPPALVKCLGKAGHEVEVLIVNSEALQRTWADEHGVVFNCENWQYEISYEQVKRFQPDILWIGSMFHYFGEYIQRLQPFCRKIFAWVACPFPKALNLSGIDCVLTSHANFQASFQLGGQASERVLPAFEPMILEQILSFQQDIDCSFVGNLSWAHIQRIQVIKQLVRQTPLQVWGDHPRLRSRGLFQRGFFRAYWAVKSYRLRMNSSVWGIEMYKILARSRMTVNVHGEIARGLAGNMRMFEATGVGTLLLTEAAPNIKELYEPDREIVTYTDIPNLVDKVQYYIKHSQECMEIARNGQHKTLSVHSTVQRANEVLDIFETYLKQ
jgi:spore maturation protein CgeB